jgi:hypothetical protein
MSYWHDSVDDPKDPWHWLGVALSVAQRAGLQQEVPDNAFFLGPKQYRLGRRLWWCLFIRDRLLSLGLQRPTRLKQGDFDVVDLGLDDFDTEQYDAEVLLTFPRCAQLFSSESQREMAIICVQTVRLCMCIGVILENLYVGFWNQGYNNRSTVSLAPKRHIEIQAVHQYENVLQQWFRNLPGVARYNPPLVSNDVDQDSIQTVFLVQKANMHMIYLSTLCVLFRHVHTDSSSQSVQILRESAAAITKMMGDLRELGLINFLINSSVTALLFAVATHLHDLKSPDTTIQAQALSHFKSCVASSQRLREIYPSTELVLSFTFAAGQVLGVDVSWT